MRFYTALVTPRVDHKEYWRWSHTDAVVLILLTQQECRIVSVFSSCIVLSRIDASSCSLMLSRRLLKFVGKDKAIKEYDTRARTKRTPQGRRIQYKGHEQRGDPRQ